HRATVRSAAVEALVRSKSATLKPFLWHVVEDADALVAEPAARSLAQEPDVAAKLVSQQTPKDTIRSAAGMWRFLSADNRAKVLQHVFSAVEYSEDPVHKAGALALLQ